MQTRIYLALPPLLLLILGVLFGYGLSLDPNSLPSPHLGKPLPEFAATDLHRDDRLIRQSDLVGPALLHVWASWCVACREEQALLLELARNEGVTLYGIDYLDQKAKARAWLRKFGDPYREILFDGDGTVGAAFTIVGVPETYLIDGQGRIRQRHAGPLTREVWRAMQMTLVPPDLSPNLPVHGDGR